MPPELEVSTESTTTVGYWPYLTAMGPSATVEPPPIWASDAEYRTSDCTTPRGICRFNQHPSPFFAMAPIAMPSGVQHPQVHVHAGVGQANTHQETRGERYIDQLSVHDSLRSFLSGHSPPMTHMRDFPLAESHAALNSPQRITALPQTTQSLGAGTGQYNWQGLATSLQQLFPRNVGTSSTTSQPSPPISMMPVSVPVMPEENAIATEACPFPNCRKKCGRPQENKRHIRERHLPHHIYCAQLGCNWTGNRRDMLRKHLERKHSGIPMPEPEAFMIYDAKKLVNQLLNNEINVEQAVSEAHLSFQNRVLQNSLHCSQSAT